MMTVGSLFSGIGGIDLGLERAGMQVIWQSEIDPYASRVLAKHWPNVPNLGDITTIEWSTVERPDLICGGYPCQPFSLAGARQGQHDRRHLWPWFLDAIRILRPRFALLENVAGHLSLGFGTVIADLAASGYDTQWDCIPAAAVGAPHRRDRLFCIATDAHSQGKYGQPINAEMGSAPEFVSHLNCDNLRQQPIELGRSGNAILPCDDGTSWVVADTDRATWHATGSATKTIFGPEAKQRFRRCRSSIGATWTAEPDVGRVAYGVPHRVDRLRTLGNAVVPQVAEFIGRQILEAVQ